MRYLNQVLPEVAAAFPAGTPTHSVRRSVAELWREMSPEEQHPYKAAHQIEAAAQKELVAHLSKTDLVTKQTLKRQQLEEKLRKQQQQQQDLGKLKRQKQQDTAVLQNGDALMSVSATRSAGRRRKVSQQSGDVISTREKLSSGESLFQMVAGTAS